MYNVLFLCTGNSARSIMAEALINHPQIGDGKFSGYSAGSHPKGVVHPLALETLAASQVPVEGLRSKSWEEFSGPDAPAMDFVFTVCDRAALEVCPIWPGHPTTAHWGVADPAAVDDTEEEQRRAFRDALVQIRRRIEMLVALPVEKLDQMAILKHVEEIGRT